MTGRMPSLNIRDLFAAKAAAAARRREEEETAEAQKKAELEAFSDRIQTYQITEDDRERALTRIRRAFEAGDRELMLVKFPSVLCEDGGRRINNHLEGWQDTLPGVMMPGDVGIFIGWPQSID